MYKTEKPNELVCPFCKHSRMEWGEQENDWVCPKCGYIGLIPEDPRSYMLPLRCR